MSRNWTELLNWVKEGDEDVNAFFQNFPIPPSPADTWSYRDGVVTLTVNNTTETALIDYLEQHMVLFKSTPTVQPVAALDHWKDPRNQKDRVGGYPGMNSCPTGWIVTLQSDKFPPPPEGAI